MGPSVSSHQRCSAPHLGTKPTKELAASAHPRHQKRPDPLAVEDPLFGRFPKRLRRNWKARIWHTSLPSNFIREVHILAVVDFPPAHARVNEVSFS